MLADTSKHMAEKLKNTTRLGVSLAAAKIGLRLFPDTTHMGLWEFADGLGQAKGYQQRVSLGPISRPESGQLVRRSVLDQLTTTITAPSRP